MLYGVNAGDVRTTHRESITDPIHVLRTVSPSFARPPVYLYILLYFLAFLVGDGRPGCPLGTLSLLTCGDAAVLALYALHVLTSMCHFFSPLLVAFPPLI